MNFKRVGKKAIINMLIPSGVFALFITIAAVVVIVSGVLKTTPSFTTTVIIVLAVIIDAVCFISPFIRYYRYRYMIDDTRVAVREGLIFIKTAIAPIERVHQLTVSEGPVDRITGLAKVTAVTAGGEIVIRFLPYDTAKELTDRLEIGVKNAAVKGLS